MTALARSIILAFLSSSTFSHSPPGRATGPTATTCIGLNGAPIGVPGAPELQFSSATLVARENRKAEPATVPQIPHPGAAPFSDSALLYFGSPQGVRPGRTHPATSAAFALGVPSFDFRERTHSCNRASAGTRRARRASATDRGWTRTTSTGARCPGAALQDPPGWMGRTTRCRQRR